jgi:hypothetical protein
LDRIGCCTFVLHGLFVPKPSRCATCHGLARVYLHGIVRQRPSMSAASDGGTYSFSYSAWGVVTDHDLPYGPEVAALACGSETTRSPRNQEYRT